MGEQDRDMGEDELMERVCAGDQLAFQQLVESYHQLVWRTICVLVPRRAPAEDVLQEVWTDVWRGLPQFQRGRAFRLWLLAIVTNRCRKTMRRPVLPQQPLETLAPEQLVAGTGLLDQWLQQEARRELRDLVEHLPQDQQRVLELHYFAELDLAEIAVVMGTSVGTVKSRLHRALGRMRMYLRSSQSTAEV